ncbi:MAG: hypothetical protein A2233_03100 [Candidatus Kerfeldbacteria bacterium RIFOXYA2_FULL_38_24]|uniref:Zinc-binding domain-containing protein n=1 Tax=Candidatus Kerfeldbacteria bacterium RIFOXYB2_FULL_38_14 TaxID=1798547 RepID=A0A1G2BAH8_9BACT|nr:MAG: hypothetical protein A2233_03100 [Candidatus Kerfeldbacteria bacterium RIFOXYA2_FULL_38_24]OGY86184.1 MAG: hypothetical protein A2319_03305 [Candidatus Kerfeldbacteria bacterium RIFOXYB2_FULL_38_14]OGY89624.1 MAG: hypothetical protein A2458_04015 [Candidatus Kerfeldbacteria bacterium RIFOXYC2_FULL_38_9]
MPKCSQCNKTFEIIDADRVFYRKMEVPDPKSCPDCRLQQKLAWRNELNFYQNTCALCKKRVLSIIDPKKQYAVYCRDCFWSDKWNALDYGQEFDFGRPFFEQFHELMQKTPTIHLLSSADNENSEYTNYIIASKNSYMCCAGGWGENVYYCIFCFRNTDCADLYVCSDNQLCYELTDSEHCYNTIYSQNCRNCTDSAFLADCTGCSSCFCSTNLKNKSYVFCNEQLDKQMYEEKMKAVKLSSHTQVEEWKRRFQQMHRTSIKRANHNTNAEQCTGDYIKNSKNCVHCYTIFDSENLKNCDFTLKIKDSMDSVQVGGGGELIYQMCTGGLQSYNLAFDIVVRACSDVWYSVVCHNSENLFGCVGVNKQKYCILNKQYSEKEYHELRKKIVEHMRQTEEYGEFFPAQYSFFGYNESAAMDFFPLTKEQAQAQGFLWQENMPVIIGKETVNIENIPDDIFEVGDNFINEILVCAECGNNYKLIPQELAFYKKMHIPIPRKCFDCRHAARMAQRNQRKVYERTCAKCHTTIPSSFAPTRPEIVYCEECYQKEVY